LAGGCGSEVYQVKTVSIFEGRGVYISPEVLDVDLPENADIKAVTLTIRTGDLHGPGHAAVNGFVETRTFDNEQWSVLGSVQAGDYQEQAVSVPVSSDRELVRWRVELSYTHGPAYVRFDTEEK
jgi:hypothetical protein